MPPVLMPATLLQETLETWRLRMPNDWEPVLWWGDLLAWRNQVYNTTIHAFRDHLQMNAQLHQIGYRDKAWSVNRLAHVARLHQLPDVTITIINTMYGYNAMEVSEAFVKVQEQAKAYLLRPEEHIHGLNLINSTNLDYFAAPHQAEMMNLKAQFLQARGEKDEAHEDPTEAAAHHGTHGETDRQADHETP